VTDDHLSLDELAEFDEGLLTPERTSEVQAHLADCAQCRARLDSITSTRNLLGGLPPEQMPADVTARIDQALAGASADASPAATVVPSLAEHRRRRFGRPTMAASAAAAVIVAAFVAIIVSHVDQPAKSTEAGNTASPRSVAQPKNYVRTSTGLNYTPNLLVTKVPHLIANIGSPSPGPATAPNASASASDGHVSPPEASTEIPSDQPVPAALRPLYNSRARLLQCAATITDTVGAIPLTVDFARWSYESFSKSPVAIFVFRDPDPSVVDVYVVGPSCSTSSIRTFTKVPVQ
jgi:hypothetical protein